jgi:hypothetical protein
MNNKKLISIISSVFSDEKTLTLNYLGYFFFGNIRY